MRAIHFLVLYSVYIYVEPQVIYIDGPVRIIDCSAQEDEGYLAVENTTPVHSYEAVLVNDPAPPPPPEIQIMATATNSITIKLKPSIPHDDTTPTLGYVIRFKPDFSVWESVQVSPPTETYILKGLWCGTQYQIDAYAYNKIGEGEKSEILNTRTKGGKPDIPEVYRLVIATSTSLHLRLNNWGDGGCPINYFVVEFKPRHQVDWTMESNQVKPTGNYVIMELTPATWYSLRITAHNNAGSSVAEYEIATLTRSGGTLS